MLALDAYPIRRKMSAKTVREECLRLCCRQSRYEGRHDVGTAEDFVAFLELKFPLQNSPEELKVLLAYSLLEGQARRW